VRSARAPKGAVLGRSLGDIRRREQMGDIRARAVVGAKLTNGERARTNAPRRMREFDLRAAQWAGAERANIAPVFKRSPRPGFEGPLPLRPEMVAPRSSTQLPPRAVRGDSCAHVRAGAPSDTGEAVCPERVQLP